MGRLSGIVLVLPLLLLASACGHQPHESEEPAAGATSPQFVLQTPWPMEETPAYGMPPSDVRALAIAFVREVCEYDTRTERPADFLAVIAPLASLEVQEQLRHSQRIQWPWRMLRHRAERATIRVDGVSLAPSRVIVRATLTTQTSFATVRSFVQLDLSVAGGVVARADGDCL